MQVTLVFPGAAAVERAEHAEGVVRRVQPVAVLVHAQQLPVRKLHDVGVEDGDVPVRRLRVDAENAAVDDAHELTSPVSGSVGDGVAAL